MPEPEITIKKITYWTPIALDDDGTPLTLHGERMIETEPGAWKEPLIVAAEEFLQPIIDAD